MFVSDIVFGGGGAFAQLSLAAALHAGVPEVGRCPSTVSFACGSLTRFHLRG